MVLSIIKGWLGEKETQFGMWMKLGNKYLRFHNIIIPINNGTTQIDHILLSRFGIFVIETKNYNGWIFGNEKSKYWTQLLYGKKFKFQNPLHQNFCHTKTLAKHLNVDHYNVHSIIFFIGNTTELKTKLPDNVMTSGLSAYIKRFKSIVFSKSDLNLFQRKIVQLKNLNISTKEHVANLNQRYSKTDICPKCGANLQKKLAKQGKYAGNYFFGCSNYPKCKYTRNIKTSKR